MKSNYADVMYIKMEQQLNAMEKNKVPEPPERKGLLAPKTNKAASEQSNQKMDPSHKVLAYMGGIRKARQEINKDGT